jgi:hypothetical protein
MEFYKMSDNNFESDFYPLFLVNGNIKLNLIAMKATITFTGWYWYDKTIDYDIIISTNKTAHLTSKTNNQTIDLIFMQDEYIIKGTYISKNPNDTGKFCIFKNHHQI